MAEQQEPFADVRMTEDGFSIPTLKWRELLFVGAMRKEEGLFTRDPSRPLPAFRIPDLFPEGQRFEASEEGGRVRLRPVG